MPDTLTDQLLAEAERLRLEASARVLAVAQAELIRNTPVRTGQLVRGWAVAIGDRPAVASSGSLPMPPDAVRMMIISAPRGEAVGLRNDVEYAEEVLTGRGIVEAAEAAAQGAV